MAESPIVTRQGSSIMIDGKVRRSLQPKLRPTPENEVIDLTAEATFVELVQMEKLERLQQYAGAGMTASQMTAAAYCCKRSSFSNKVHAPPKIAAKDRGIRYLVLLCLILVAALDTIGIKVATTGVLLIKAEKKPIPRLIPNIDKL